MHKSLLLLICHYILHFTFCMSAQLLEKPDFSENKTANINVADENVVNKDSADLDDNPDSDSDEDQEPKKLFSHFPQLKPHQRQALRDLQLDNPTYAAVFGKKYAVLTTPKIRPVKVGMEKLRRKSAPHALFLDDYTHENKHANFEELDESEVQSEPTVFKRKNNKERKVLKRAGTDLSEAENGRTVSSEEHLLKLSPEPFDDAKKELKVDELIPHDNNTIQAHIPKQHIEELNDPGKPVKATKEQVQTPTTATEFEPTETQKPFQPDPSSQAKVTETHQDHAITIIESGQVSSHQHETSLPIPSTSLQNEIVKPTAKMPAVKKVENGAEQIPQDKHESKNNPNFTTPSNPTNGAMDGKDKLELHANILQALFEEQDPFALSISTKLFLAFSLVFIVVAAVMSGIWAAKQQKADLEFSNSTSSNRRNMSRPSMGGFIRR